MVTLQLCLTLLLACSVLAINFTYPHILPTQRRVASGLNASITRTYISATATSSIKAFLSNYTTTTYSIEPFPTDTHNIYGSNAYKALWAPLNITQPSLQATVTPVPVPVNELTYPPTVPRVHASPRLQNATLGPNTIWGLASSAQQCEGVPLAEGSGPSILDTLYHQLLSTTANNSDITGLNYYLYKQDIARLAAAGVQSYSFSIKWSRVVPFGKAGSPINQQAIEHYSDLIDTCRQYGLNPIVTLTHFDTPANIAPLGRVLADKYYGAFNAGYDQPTFVEDYLYYAKYIVATFGDRVGTFFTFNEPQGVSANIIGARNVQLAHAHLYRFYHSVVNGSAEITYKQTVNFAVPYNASSPIDVAAANRQNDISFGLFSNAPFLGQQLPDAITTTINNSTLAPLFSAAELSLINGTTDFFAVDTYSAQFVTAPDVGIDACARDPSNTLWPICVNASSIDPYTGYILNGVGEPASALTAGGSPLALTPAIERLTLRYINERYKPAGGILVSELGYAANNADNTPFASLITDNERAEYLTEYYRAILQAKHEDGVNVRGILTWSATDNWEFGNYKQRFGVQFVDYDSPNKTRTYKVSMFSMLDFFERFTY